MEPTKSGGQSIPTSPSRFAGSSRATVEAPSDALDSLYIAYWSLNDPLTQSQSLPIIRALTAAGYRMGLMTFESERFRLGANEQQSQALSLNGEGISWFPLRYHRNPPVLSTLWNIAQGSWRACRTARRRGLRLFHSRGSVAAAMASLAAQHTGSKFFYDADGPLSQEYVDIGLWNNGSWVHRATRSAEESFCRKADALAVLTTTRSRQIQPLTQHSIRVLPCGVDTDLFRIDAGSRQQLRQELGLRGTTFVYVGKWGSWYAVEEMFDFLSVARRRFDPMSILIVSMEPEEPFLKAAAKRGLSDCLTIRSGSRTEMPKYLSCADVALSFVRPLPSKTACSPVKNGEYLATGLPIVTPGGIGDYSDLIAQRRVGAVLDTFSTEAYRRAAEELQALLADPALASRCRTTAETELSLARVVIPRYLDLYRELLGHGTVRG